MEVTELRPRDIKWPAQGHAWWSHDTGWLLEPGCPVSQARIFSTVSSGPLGMQIPEHPLRSGVGSRIMHPKSLGNPKGGAASVTWGCALLSCLVISESSRPHGWQPSRLLCPWGFSRQEYWSGLPCSPPGDVPNPGAKPKSPALQEILYWWSHQGSPTSC